MASDDLVAIVTGAAQGLGYAICDHLLKEGYRVCLADINKDKGEESLAELQKTYAEHKLIYVECDIRSETNFEESFSRTLEAFGRIDLLVNNAGIVDERDPQRTVAINLMGTIIGSQLALKFMGTKNGGKGGVVVNVSSIAGLAYGERLPVYSATKHGIVGLTRSYGNEYHFNKNGVLFMAICPYYIQTPMLLTANAAGSHRDPMMEYAMKPEFVAEGVLKLLNDRENGSILLVIPGKFIYIGIPEELRKLKP